MQDDTQLITHAQRGDADAFEALLAPHERKIYALCLRILGNQEDAKDCAQEAILRIWRSLGTYRRQASFTTWSCRIATNVCLDLLRRNKARPAVSLDTVAEVRFEATDGRADPHAQAETAARKRAMTEGIAELSPDMRAALVLRDVQGFSYDEVAEVLQVPLGTVKSRVSRARDRLRDALRMDAELFPELTVYADERRRDE
ncbi:sigma-70 family RNA polymerase sigma factor [Eubacteriales bacterium OttesenSCG-928-A19]|nr:sigma-70 family RNA polymerase sigma factor [Eubacteriales bacterium OttesenSCG-928-A19]